MQLEDEGRRLRHQRQAGAWLSACPSTAEPQVRFIYETFRRLHPGLPLLHLLGKQKQTTRLTTFKRFSAATNSLLICTDVAARGLDFPLVDWVIQLDCPDDVDTYIHRVGRTARYQSEGKGLLFLLPSEEAMLRRLEERGLEVKGLKIKASRMGDIKQQMQNYCFKEPEVRYLAQKVRLCIRETLMAQAFVLYMRSVWLQKDKEVFDVAQLPAEAFAESMGLAGAPQISFGKETASGRRKGRRGGDGAGGAAEVTKTDVAESTNTMARLESESDDGDLGAPSSDSEESDAGGVQQDEEHVKVCCPRPSRFLR